MEDRCKTIHHYDAARAVQYDEESQITRGNRVAQRECLVDILCHFASRGMADSFLELACGTGYFTQVFYEVFPHVSGLAVDGSADMLEIARARFAEKPYHLTFEQCLMEEFDWSSLSVKPAIIFSALAIHHLVDDHKWRLYQQVYEHLASPGIFILFDSFRPPDPLADELIEYLACKTIQRRLNEQQERNVALQTIIQKDREVKAAEGDHEASLEEHYHKLKEIGFEGVVSVFQEARYAGLVAYKSEVT